MTYTQELIAMDERQEEEALDTTSITSELGNVFGIRNSFTQEAPRWPDDAQGIQQFIEDGRDLFQSYCCMFDQTTPFHH